MERPIVTIPTSAIRDTIHDWDIDWRNRETGTTLRGVTKAVVDGFPRFVGSPRLFLIGAEYRRIRTTIMTARGNAGIYRIPMYDPISYRRKTTNITMSTGQTFNTGLFMEEVETVVAAAPAAAGSTEVLFDVPTGHPTPVYGQLMSHGRDWPFVVTNVDAHATVADRYTMRVEPPLRADIEIGDEIRHDAIGRFEITEQGGNLPSYGGDEAGVHQFSFREVITR